MVRVLFVCLGNICRSPMAEAVFRHLVRQAGWEERIEIDSAGLGGWHEGQPPHPGTQQTLRQRGIDYEGIRARQIKVEDLTKFDYVVCMDEENLAGLKRLAPQATNVYKLLDFSDQANEKNVEDPYYTGRFEYVYELVESGCRGLLQTISKEWNGEK